MTRDKGNDLDMKIEGVPQSEVLDYIIKMQDDPDDEIHANAKPVFNQSDIMLT